MDVHLRELFGLFQQQFGLGPGLGPGSGTSLINVDGASTAFLKAVFRAAAALFRSNPWKRLKASNLFGIRVGKDAEWHAGRQPFFCAQFVGGGGMGDQGLNLFRSEADAMGMIAKGAGHIKSIPSNGLLRITFAPEAELSAGNKKMIKSLGLEVAGPKAFPVIDVVYSVKAVADAFPSFRNPTLEELRWLYACLRAITQVHPLLQQVESKGRGLMNGTVIYEEFAQNVDVQWPADDVKAWGFTSVRVTLPLRDEHEEQINPPPKLAEPMDASLDLVEWSVPRKCAMCEKEVPANAAPRCSRCKAVIYCGHACQKKHWKEVHKGSCEFYKAVMERKDQLEMKGFHFLCVLEHGCKWLEAIGLHGKGMWRRMCGCFKRYPFGLLPPQEGGGTAGAWGLEHGKYPVDTPLLDYVGSGDSPSILLLSGWAEYYNVRALPMSSPVAALLCFPLSLYHIITSLSVLTKNLLGKGREVVVHYLGPESELDWLPSFSELGHLLGGSCNLHIMMIGPSVPSSLSGAATSLGRKVKVTFVQGLYQEEANSLIPPQVVVTLNSGIESYSSWMGALEVIKAQAVPAFFTDYSESCCAKAKQVLRATGLQISYPVTLNPFRSPVQNQNPSSNLPEFSNGFIFGVNT